MLKSRHLQWHLDLSLPYRLNDWRMRSEEDGDVLLSFELSDRMKRPQLRSRPLVRNKDFTFWTDLVGVDQFCQEHLHLQHSYSET